VIVQPTIEALHKQIDAQNTVITALLLIAGIILGLMSFSGRIPARLADRIAVGAFVFSIAVSIAVGVLS
jgi:hypothetical protein